MGEKLPVRKIVSELVSGRYLAGDRPVSWDDRAPAVECVKTTDGQVILLNSNGQQSTPAPFWELLLTESAPVLPTEMPKIPSDLSPDRVAYTWTLYGIGKGAPLGRYASKIKSEKGDFSGVHSDHKTGVVLKTGGDV